MRYFGKIIACIAFCLLVAIVGSLGRVFPLELVVVKSDGLVKGIPLSIEVQARF